MRLLGRTERQRRNLPCRASPAECCQERREFLSRPFHNFSIGRHLWFGPLRSRPPRREVQPQTEYRSDRSETFAYEFPRAVSCLGLSKMQPACHCEERAVVSVSSGKQNSFERMGLKSAAGGGAKSPAHWTICQRAVSVSIRVGRLSKREERMCRAGAQAISLAGLEMPHSRDVYEFTVEESSKLHLTTRMVTSSLKLSPQ